MQDNLQVVDILETAIPALVELTPEQLLQVGGGLGPAGTWATATATQGPAGTW